MFNLHELFKVSAGVGVVLRANGSTQQRSNVVHTHKRGLLLVDVRPVYYDQYREIRAFGFIIISRTYVPMLVVKMVIKHFFFCSCHHIIANNKLTAPYNSSRACKCMLCRHVQGGKVWNYDKNAECQEILECRSLHIRLEFKID